MRYRLFIRGTALGLLVLGTVADALAGTATDQSKPEIDRVIATIENPALQAASRTADRRQAVRAITDRIFDWTEMSKRALGRHWEARTGAERAEFIPLFRELLERAFFGKIEQYGAENVADTEESPDGNDTIVRTRVTLKPQRGSRRGLSNGVAGHPVDDRRRAGRPHQPRAELPLAVRLRHQAVVVRGPRHEDQEPPALNG